MKTRYFAVLLLLALLFSLAACTSQNPAPDADAPDPIPQELLATWVSASGGDLNIIETMSYYEDGTFSVQCDYNGEDVGTIYGSFTIERDTLIANVTEGAEPYTIEYRFAVDGAVLTLTNDDNTATYRRAD
ncbi:MAG: hypothetical protein LBM28_03405 [Oscillospiraceae bacterium]|jgi:hypothetical protein|nr:hypothetical protein [Oscillospiraceae bacterium]